LEIEISGCDDGVAVGREVGFWLGEGVVTGIEAGGVVVVRFAADGSERRLVLDYAPLERLST